MFKATSGARWAPAPRSPCASPRRLTPEIPKTQKKPRTAGKPHGPHEGCIRWTQAKFHMRFKMTVLYHTLLLLCQYYIYQGNSGPLKQEIYYQNWTLNSMPWNHATTIFTQCYIYIYNIDISVVTIFQFHQIASPNKMVMETSSGRVANGQPVPESVVSIS